LEHAHHQRRQRLAAQQRRLRRSGVTSSRRSIPVLRSNWIEATTVPIRK
jgi:hypothetical protein